MARGGFREGAGRPAGSTNKSSPEQSQRLSELAKTYTQEALQTLVDVAKHGRTDAARVSAACALLDRAFGKPKTAAENIQPVQTNLLFRVIEEYDSPPDA